jgi:hypothetical protein
MSMDFQPRQLSPWEDWSGRRSPIPLGIIDIGDHAKPGYRISAPLSASLAACSQILVKTWLSATMGMSNRSLGRRKLLQCDLDQPGKLQEKAF